MKTCGHEHRVEDRERTDDGLAEVPADVEGEPARRGHPDDVPVMGVVQGELREGGGWGSGNVAAGRQAVFRITRRDVCASYRGTGPPDRINPPTVS
jgi:hypothetical protein